MFPLVVEGCFESGATSHVGGRGGRCLEKSEVVLFKSLEDVGLPCNHEQGEGQSLAWKERDSEREFATKKSQ